MPQKLFDSLSRENLEQASRYRPGYDWIPGYFGPPPGIPEAKKLEFDRMNDKEYLYAFLRLSQEQKESLMISEAERRRTFNAHWPIQHVVRGNDLAKEGFYYTGIADKVQCAFCGGIIRNWERGDNPAQSHRAYFDYCKMVQRKPCFNIPFDDTDDCKALVTEQLSLQGMTDSYYGIWFCNNTCRPANMKYASLPSRLETFKNYPSSNSLSPDDLASAGFYLLGSPDNLVCFWCDGSLRNWVGGGDVWRQHAILFPGCAFVRESKGINFILQSRASMSKEEVMTSRELKYNSSDLSFLEDLDEENFDLKNLGKNKDHNRPSKDLRGALLQAPDEAMEVKIKNYPKYKILIKLGIDGELVKRVYGLNGGMEFDDMQDLITLVEALATEDESLIETILRTLTMAKEAVSRDDQKLQVLSEHSSKRQIDATELLKQSRDLTEEESQVVVEALTCTLCMKNEVGAVLLPCGHFTICESCSWGELPGKCPGCGSTVRAACRAFTS